MLDEKTIENDPSSLFNGNHYPSKYIYSILHILTVVFPGTRNGIPRKLPINCTRNL